MKKLLLGSVALLALSVGGPALAADYAAPAYKAPPPSPMYNWSGYYVGFNIGGQWNDVDRQFPNATGGGFVAGRPFSTESRDGIFGFHAGLQYQFGYWVLGIETALNAGFDEMRSVSGLLPASVGGLPGFTPNTTGEHKVTNLFTVGPKIGYAFDRWMIYGTGGYASADLKGTYCNATTGICGPGITTQNGQSRNSGWFAGAGIDYMIHKGSLVDVLLGAEYQHWDVDSKNAFCANLGCNPASGADYNLAASGDIFRAKLTIKYNPWSSAPVYAKY
ncbi:MAG TPA: outer membrane beta-barrel protein [Xanthobacteraceae bacterium]|jgi:outer membrane immunogenic protein